MTKGCDKERVSGWDWKVWKNEDASQRNEHAHLTVFGNSLSYIYADWNGTNFHGGCECGRATAFVCPDSRQPKV